ncbi:hypothetical protein C8J56DRAFT_390367 [Mycena floridula]|nr:hypothetical protein C8J56DRAFT_390367 [Mycena floridula]
MPHKAQKICSGLSLALQRCHVARCPTLLQNSLHLFLSSYSLNLNRSSLMDSVFVSVPSNPEALPQDGNKFAHATKSSHQGIQPQIQRSRNPMLASAQYPSHCGDMIVLVPLRLFRCTDRHKYLFQHFSDVHFIILLRWIDVYLFTQIRDPCHPNLIPRFRWTSHLGRNEYGRGEGEYFWG